MGIHRLGQFDLAATTKSQVPEASLDLVLLSKRCYFDYILGPAVRLAGNLSIYSHRTHEVPIRGGRVTTRRLPRSLETNRIELTGGDNVAR